MHLPEDPIEKSARDVPRHRDTVTEGRAISIHGPRTAGSASRDEELGRLTRAIQALPERCRQVLTLRKIYGLSQREIATRLGLPESTVEAEVADGVRRCARFLSNPGQP